MTSVAFLMLSSLRPMTATFGDSTDRSPVLKPGAAQWARIGAAIAILGRCRGALTH